MKINTARSHSHRQSYVPTWPPERFIVPLLAQRIPELFRRFCLPSSDAPLALDVGCGTQPFRRMLQEAGYAYRSLDVVQNEQGTVDYLGAIDGTLPHGLLGAAPFEFVLLTEVLEHVAGWEQAFDNIATLLSPTGSVLLSCPHVYVPHEEPFDFWRPTTHAIVHFASRYGLRVRHLERAGTPADVLGTILEDTQCYPAAKDFSSRVMAWVARGMRSILLRGLHSSKCRAKVEFRGGTYLSCLAVLCKAGEASL